MKEKGILLYEENLINIRRTSFPCTILFTSRSPAVIVHDLHNKMNLRESLVNSELRRKKKTKIANYNFDNLIKLIHTCDSE